MVDAVQLAFIWVHEAPDPALATGAAGVPGDTVTGSEPAELVPHEFRAVTVISPPWPADPVTTAMEVVPCPAEIVQPVGTVHV